MPEIFTIMSCDEARANAYKSRIINYEREIIQIKGVDLFDFESNQDEKEIPPGIIISKNIPHLLEEKYLSRCLLLNEDYPPTIEEGNWIREAYYDKTDFSLSNQVGKGVKNCQMVLIKNAYSFNASRPYERIMFKETVVSYKKDFLLLIYFDTQLKIYFQKKYYDGFEF